jgi:hypothetical protein
MFFFSCLISLLNSSILALGSSDLVIHVTRQCFCSKLNNLLCISKHYFIVTIWQGRIIARLQRPYSLDCIHVEAEYQVGEHKWSLN